MDMGENEKDSLIKKLNDAIYESIQPINLSVWHGCNSNPEDLAKHISSSYVSTLCCLITEDEPDAVYQNAIDEIVYDVSGKPSCFSSDMTKYFLKKSIQEILDE